MSYVLLFICFNADFIRKVISQVKLFFKYFTLYTTHKAIHLFMRHFHSIFFNKLFHFLYKSFSIFYNLLYWSPDLTTHI